MFFIGIDIGTTSICAILYDSGHDKVVKELHGENHFLPGEGFMQDPEEIAGTSRRLLEGLLEDICPERKESLYREERPGHRENEGPQIGGIGISSQMHGILYVNREGKAVSPFYTWKNEWGNESYRDGKSYAEYLSEQTGMNLYSGYGSVTHFYLQERRMIPEEAVAFVNIGDYFAMELTGSIKFLADVTIAASFGGFDLKRRQFDLSAMETAGVDASYYPEVTEGKEAGVFEGIPVFCAVGDNQASFLGAIRDRNGSVSVNVGTGSQVSVFSEELYEIGKGEVRPFPGGGWLYVGASVNGGKVYERLAVFFKEIMDSFGAGVEQGAVYEIMERLGRNKKETDLMVRPSLYGVRENVRGERIRENGAEETVREGGREETAAAASGIFGLKEDNFHASDLVRGFVSGMADELYELYLGFPEELRRGKSGITASGNGIRKNPLLKEEIEKLYKMPVSFTDREEEAATGAAAMAENLVHSLRNKLL